MPTPTTGSPITSVALTGNTFDSLLWGMKWGGVQGTGTTLTYSFPGWTATWSTNAISGYGANTGTGEPWSLNYAPLSQISEQTAFTNALATWSNVANLTFVRVADTAIGVGDIRVAYTNTPNAAAWAYGPYNGAVGGDVWLSSVYSMAAVQRGDYQHLTLVHELGHALGLQHTFDPPNPLAVNLDYLWNTVMSYTDWYGNIAGTPTAVNGGLSFYPTTPMSLDIEAMQYLYGANTGFHAGNDTYVYSQANNYLETIWDAGGIDTIQYNATTTGGYIDLTPGGWSKLGKSIDIWNANGIVVAAETRTVNIFKTVTIENATGSNFADTIIGNDVANRLFGNGGDDSIGGGSGNDILNGGLGNDFLSGGLGTDWAYYNNATSGVTVKLNLTSAQNTLSCGIDTLTGIECLLGSGYNDTLFGNASANSLSGGAGNDYLNGGAGNDSLFGDAGNDVIIGSTGKDVLFGGAGRDSFYFYNVAESAVGTNRDVIRDFTCGQDRINLATIDANSTTVGVNDAFTFTTGASFTAAGQLRFANGILYGNTDGNLATAEFEIALTGVATLTATDFVL